MNKIGTLIFSQHKNELGLLAKLAAAESLPLYLVGGCIRDHFLKRNSADYDFVTATDPSRLAKNFARQINGHWFSLDDKRGYSRVVTRCAAKLQFDFAPFRGSTLEIDLSLRDFTINAMALPLKFPLEDAELFDPLNGQGDLAQQRLRMCSDLVFSADPLRIVKGIRHCAQLDLDVAENTQQQFIAHAPLLDQVAGERILSELSQIFSAQNNGAAVQWLFDYGVAESLKLSAPKDEVIAICHAVEQHIIEFKQQNIADIMIQIDSVCGDGFSVRGIAYFLAILDGCGVCAKNLDELLKRLHFEKRTARLLRFFLNTQGDEFSEYHQLSCSDRGNLLWLQHHHAPLPQALIFSQLLGISGVDSRRLFALQQCYAQSANNGRIQSLLSAQYIRQFVPDCSGPQLGEYIKLIEQAEIDGSITSVADAQHYLDNCCKYN